MKQVNFLDYEAPKTVWKFLQSNAKKNLIVGPVGSSKSTGLTIKCFLIAASVMVDVRDGLRKSKIGVTRNTRDQLLQTVIPNFLKWFPPDGKNIIYLKKEGIMRLNIGNIQTEFIFIPLDNSEDVRRLLSLNVTAYAFDEFREIHKDIYENAFSRTGRYPETIRENNDPKGKILYGPYNDDGESVRQVFGASNPPNEGSYWANILLDPPEDTQIFWQPSGLSPDAENISHLPENYYEDLCIGKSQNWINVNVHGKLGQNKDGMPVYQSFIPEYHVSEDILKPLPNQKVIVGMDFGLNPSAVFVQQNAKGQIVVLDEIVSNGIGLDKFLNNFFFPLKRDRYFGYDMLVLGDPTGVNRSESDENTVYQILKNKGLRAKTAATNNPIARITAVEELFSRQIDGKPGLLISNHLRWLIAGFRGGYKYKKKKDTEQDEIQKDLPEKDKYSHPQDALQYACLYFHNPAKADDDFQKKSFRGGNAVALKYYGY